MQQPTTVKAKASLIIEQIGESTEQNPQNLYSYMCFPVNIAF